MLVGVSGIVSDCASKRQFINSNLIFDQIRISAVWEAIREFENLDNYIHKNLFYLLTPCGLLVITVIWENQ